MENKLTNSFVSYLNTLLSKDKEAMIKLVTNRVECNNIFADDEFVHVVVDEDKNVCLVGLLGIINGFLAKENNNTIMQVIEEDGGTFFVKCTEQYPVVQ